MEIRLTEEEVRHALAVHVFTTTGFRVPVDKINLTVVIPFHDGAQLRKIDQAVLEIEK